MPTATDNSGTAVSGAGAMLQLVRDGRANTRAELVDLTGLARSTVSQRVDALLARGLLMPAGSVTSTGGRPPTVLAFNAAAGVVLAADLGVTRCHAAVTDLAATSLAEVTYDIAVEDGPDLILSELIERFGRLLAEAGVSRRDVHGAGIGLPAPVDFATGRPVDPPIMPGWHDAPVADRLRDALDTPVLVDNDANLMALGEHRLSWRSTAQLLFVKAGTGIGSGIVANGAIYRGTEGAAGDLGHIRAPGAGQLLCACGNTGCLETVAGGQALAAQLTATGIPAPSARDVAERVRAGDRTAISLVRQAGREIGDVLASIVNFFNPSVIVFGGDTADASDDLLAGVREVVYRRSLPLATRNLTITHSAAGPRAGVVGAAVMAVEHVLDPAAVDGALSAPA